jgi:cardiolipin synthase
MFKHIPNILTIIRFLLIPVIVVFCLQENYILAIIFLTVSGITDILDGLIARKYNLITDFGKLMDPLADKATQVSLLTILVIKNMIPIWILVIVVLKEFCMVSGASFLYGKELVVSSKWYGKLATVLFYLAIVTSLVVEQLQGMIQFNVTLVKNINIAIYYAAVVTTVMSLLLYIKAFYVQGYLKNNAK